MLKTIKTTKHMRFDELVKYVWDNMNDLFESYGILKYYSHYGKEVIFYNDGLFDVESYVGLDDYFEIEVKEEITEDTKFELLVGVYLYDDDGYVSATFYNGSIDDMKDSEALCIYELIYALINGKLELIWERDNL